MRGTLSTTMALAVLLAAGAATSTSAAPDLTGVAADRFYRCPSGFAFESRQGAARCHKPAGQITRTLADCIVGLYPVTDRVGNKDMCAGTNPVTGEVSVERGCKADDLANGFTKRIVAGKDFCAKATPEEVQPPTVAVTLS